jgi:hypothetical protein
MNSIIAVYVLIIQLFSLVVNLFLLFWQKDFKTIFLPNHVSIVCLFSLVVNPSIIMWQNRHILNYANSSAPGNETCRWCPVVFT